MAIGRPIAELALSEVERETLERWVRRPKTAQALALRARIILACAEGATNTPASRDTVRRDTEGKRVESVTWRDGRRYSIRRTYTDRDQADSVIVAGPWGTRAYVYTYDAYGRLDGLRDFGGKWTRIYLNGEGSMDSVRLPTAGAMRLSFSTNARHQLTRVSGPTQLSHEYRYTSRGLLRVDSTQNVNYPLRWSEYTYDGLDRLASWKHYMHTIELCIGRDCTPTHRDSLAQQATFLWDSVGNPKGAPLSAGNRLRAYAGYSMDYDADGNLSRKYNASGWDQSFTWNALGQLTGVSRVGASTLTYAYDGFGRRVKRTDVSTGAVTQFIYDGDDLALEVDGAGNLIREYTYYPGIDQPHGMRQWANGANGAAYYYVLQQPGHVQALVSATDTLVNQYRYTPFGMPMNGTPAPGTPDPLRFMARELDEGTGLYYVRNRWYDPQVGRFVSEDPIGLAGGINPYAYVGNDPVSFRDPSGTTPCTWYWVIVEFPDRVVYTRVQSSGCDDESSGGGGGSGWGGGSGGSGGSGGAGTGGGGGGGGGASTRAWHYGRNGLNQVPRTANDAAKADWKRLSPGESRYHRMGPNGDGNTKWISPNGRHEAVYDASGQLVTDPINMGTYNRAPPQYPVTHLFYDIVPYYIYGNTADDPTNMLQRVFGCLSLSECLGRR